MSAITPLPTTPIDLPLLPLRDVVVFPHMVIPLFVGRPKSIKALETAMAADRRIMLVAQKTAAKDEPAVNDMFEVGCVSTILQMLKLPDGTVKVLVEGHQRASVNKIEEGEAFFSANVTPVPAGSACRCSISACSSRHIAMSIALSLAGLASVRCATPSASLGSSVIVPGMVAAPPCVSRASRPRPSRPRPSA